MLAVAVDLHRDVVALRKRVLVTRLHGAADAEVEGVADDRRALRLRLGDGVVDGPVVDDQHVPARLLSLDVTNDPSDHALLVVGGHDRE